MNRSLNAPVNMSCFCHVQLLFLPCSLAFRLKELVLANNTGLVGRLPDEAGGLPHLTRVNIYSTGMSCVPGDLALAEALADAAANGTVRNNYHRCTDNETLPCFLEFEAYDVPRGDESHLRCRPIKRKPAHVVAQVCPNATGSLLVEEGSAEDVSQQWDLPPAYYQFRGCACLEGFVAEWTRGDTHLTCKPARSGAVPPWTWAVVALGAVGLLLAGALLCVGSRWVLFKSRWLREAELRRKRAKGLPRAGAQFSVVVTDIEGYSGAHRLAWLPGPSGVSTAGRLACAQHV